MKRFTLFLVALTAAPAAGAEVSIRPSGTPISAADRAFWSFRPIADPPLPAVKDRSWPSKPLDHFILAKLEARGLHPVRPADRRALLRRVTFDLIGLPPTPAEVEAFLADTAPGAFARVVERLLASPHYGERWARHWLDVARYAEDQAHTFQARLYPHGWRYRDWVARAFNDDLPYDRFVTAQIAGDLLEGDPAARLPALGFNALGPVYYVDGSKRKEVEAAELDDRIDTLTRGFLGLTVSCARCHDHKFDPISQADYYALAGVFRSAQYQLALVAPPEVAARYRQAQGRVQEQESAVQGLLDEEGARLAEEQVGQVARYMVAAWKLQTRRNADPRVNAASLARAEKLQPAALNRWSRYLFLRGSDRRPHLAGWRRALVGLPANRDLSADPSALAKVTAAANAFQAELQDLLRQRDVLKNTGKRLDGARAAQLNEVFGAKGLLGLQPRQVERQLAGPAKALLAGLRAELARRRKALPPAPPLAHALTEGRAADMPIYLRGNPHTEGPIVPRRFLRIVAGDDPPRFTKGSGRLELARAIASADNPLTARVMVNRLWQHHFGKGIVPTPSNFGKLGEPPSHPELLDHLARRFSAGGWSIKALHREILLSATYRLAAVRDERNAAVDPANTLYWRMNRRRLDVEAWRDALLAVAGTLDGRLGGPAVDLAAGTTRRTLYARVSRHELNPLLRLFDFPDPNITSAARPVTIVPLQGLFVLNSEFMVAQARALARSLAGAGKDDGQRIPAAYLRLYGRPAQAWEVKLGREFLSAPQAGRRPDLSRWEQYAQVLLAANEFTFLD
jgi:hypothetical protein